MGLEFHEEKDLTGTYKQLKKIIASALGEEEFETITNTDVKVVANSIWECCYKKSIVGIE